MPLCKKLTELVLMLSCVIFFNSCTKTADPGTPVPANTSTGSVNGHNDPSIEANDRSGLKQLFSAFCSSPQVLSVTAGQYYRVWGAQGTMLRFYPNSFKNAAGNIITSGTIEIKLVEMYKPGAMISNMAATTANGALLASGGQVRITATMNGHPVYANKFSIGFKQPAATSKPMELYYGNAANADSLVTWTIANNTGGGTAATGTVTISDSAKTNPPVVWQGPPPPQGSLNYYVFDTCTNFDLINCDHFTGYPNLTDVSVVAPDSTFDASNTCVFMIFPDINSVTKVKEYNFHTNTFTLGSSYRVPAGQVVTVVAMTSKSGNYYYFVATNITVTANMAINLNMQPQTFTYITTALSNL